MRTIDLPHSELQQLYGKGTVIEEWEGYVKVVFTAPDGPRIGIYRTEGGKT